MYKVFSGANNSSKSNSCIPQSGVSQISPKNYTNILKSVHENIDSYVGKKICFTGYVYRVLDLQDNQFVLARDMIVSSNSMLKILLIIHGFKLLVRFLRVIIMVICLL